MRKKIASLVKLAFIAILLAFLSGCSSNKEIISHIQEKEANVILVLLESKGIPASKLLSSSGAIGGGDTTQKYKILVPEKHSIAAIAYLNQNGFPREKGTNLLDLFAKQGLMTTDKEETIRFRAGLAQQLANTILMIDGVIDASVQLAFPEEEVTATGEQQKGKITAAVYVKHQGVIDDPNIHLENKIKRLISGSISGLDINDVTVVSDRSRFTDITLGPSSELIGARPGEYVNIWSIVMSKESVARFRVLFFFITSLTLFLAILLGWLIWKFYPTLKKKGALKDLFNPIPWLSIKKKTPKPPEEGET